MKTPPQTITVPGWLAQWAPAVVVVGFVACLVGGAAIGGAFGKPAPASQSTVSTREFMLRVPALEIERICRVECAGGISSLPPEIPQ